MRDCIWQLSALSMAQVKMREVPSSIRARRAAMAKTDRHEENSECSGWGLPSMSERLQCNRERYREHLVVNPCHDCHFFSSNEFHEHVVSLDVPWCHYLFRFPGVEFQPTSCLFCQLYVISKTQWRGNTIHTIAPVWAQRIPISLWDFIRRF